MIAEDVDIISDFKKRSSFNEGNGILMDLDRDIEDLIQKYKGTILEVAVHHMKDSLIIFQHNIEQYNNYRGFRSSLISKQRYDS